MNSVTGHAQHLQPHGHPPDAVITHQDGVYRLTCCGAESPTLPGLGQFACRTTVQPASVPIQACIYVNPFDRLEEAV